jgi:hypothetical protein
MQGPGGGSPAAARGSPRPQPATTRKPLNGKVEVLELAPGPSRVRTLSHGA